MKIVASTLAGLGLVIAAASAQADILAANGVIHEVDTVMFKDWWKD